MDAMQIQSIIPTDATVIRWNANIDVLSDRSTQLVIENLEKIQKNSIGSLLLKRISAFDVQVIIQNSEKGEEHTESWLKDGKKCFLSLITLPSKKIDVLSSSLEKISMPTDVLIFHELVHVYHKISGELQDDIMTPLCDPLIWTTDEEYRTIMGFLPKDLTENAYRKAAGLPERFSHWTADVDPLVRKRLERISAIYQSTRRDQIHGDEINFLSKEFHFETSTHFCIFFRTKSERFYICLTPDYECDKSYITNCDQAKLRECEKLLRVIYPHRTIVDGDVIKSYTLRITPEERNATVD